MSAPTRKCGSVFYHSLSLVNKDHNNEYPLKKFKQFTNCSFGETSSQRLVTSPYMWDWLWVIKQRRKERRKEGSKQATN